MFAQSSLPECSWDKDAMTCYHNCRDRAAHNSSLAEIGGCMDNLLGVGGSTDSPTKSFYANRGPSQLDSAANDDIVNMQGVEEEDAFQQSGPTADEFWDDGMSGADADFWGGVDWSDLDPNGKMGHTEVFELPNGAKVTTTVKKLRHRD